MSSITDKRIDNILSQLQLNNTRAAGDSGILESPYKPLDIPTNLSFHQFLFKRWNEKKFDNMKALTDAATGETWTYKQLKQNIIQFSNGLYDQGVRQHSVLGIYSSNCLEYSTVVYACSVLGAVCCLINPVYTDNELLHHLNDSGASHLFTQSAKVDIVHKVQSKANKLKHIFTFDNNNKSLKTFADVLNQGKSQGASMLHEGKIDPVNDIQILPYSSGTTGLAKGVMLTHYNLLSNVLQFNDSRYLDVGEPGEVLNCVLPLYHIYAASCIMNMGLYNGSHIIILNGFAPDTFLETIQKYKVERMALVPPLINFMTKSPLTDKYDLSSVKHVSSGAAPLTKENEQEFQAKFKGLRIKQGYGMSETSPVTHAHPANNIRGGSIGKLICNMTAKIVDPETGKTVPAGSGKRGELWLAGPNIMKGYWRNEKSTKDTIDSDGYLHTGDVAYVDNDGYYYIVDRIKELIKVKGLQVAPAELEGLLLSHPDIDDAAVIQVPDERAGELPRAYVVKKSGANLSEQQVKDYIAKQVAPHKKLDGGVKFIAAVPKAASGKILRRELRELAKKEG